MPRYEFELLKIETYILKVNINCQGCRNKVKKLLTKVEGVHAVKIDAEGERVIVSGIVDPTTLINKLLRYGKHAELWYPSSNQNQEQALQITENMKRNRIQYLMNRNDHFNGSQNQHYFLPPSFGSEVAEDDWSIVNNHDQDLAMKAMAGEIHPNFRGGRKVYMGGDGYNYGNGAALSGHRFDSVPESYHFHEYDQLSPMNMMMPNMQQYQYYNQPLQYVYDDMYLYHHPYANHRSSLVAPYADYSLVTPYSYY